MSRHLTSMRAAIDCLWDVTAAESSRLFISGQQRTPITSLHSICHQRTTKDRHEMSVDQNLDTKTADLLLGLAVTGKWRL